MVFAEHVKIREEKFGAVVFETLKEKVYVTNPTGKVIVNLLGQGYSEEEIVKHLQKIYRGEPNQMNTDVKEFVNQLMKKGIIQK